MPSKPGNPSCTIDTSGQCCPVPIIEVNRAIKTMQPGEVLELVATDLGARMDIPAWCVRTGHELIRVENTGGKFRFYVRKRG